MSGETGTPIGTRATGIDDNPIADPTPLWVVFGLSMGPVVALGLSRFAYALLLPAMRTDLGWTFADAGAMNTANAIGYLAGALVAAPLGRRFSGKSLFALGLLLTSIATGSSALCSSFSALLALRLVTGCAAAIAFVFGAGLTSAATMGGPAARRATQLGIYFAGAGIGIAASALAVPPLMDKLGWRGGWLILGCLAIAATLYGWIVLRRTTEPRYARAISQGGWSPRLMAFELLSYGLFGAGYISYATFIIAYLHARLGFDANSVTAFWALLGLSAVVGAFAWGPILFRLKGGKGAAATISIVAFGSALPLLSPTPTGAYISAILFGSSFLAVITAVTSFARISVKPSSLNAAISALTVSFGIGQCVGPVVSGALSDGANGIRSGLWLSVGILVAAAVVAALQPEMIAE